MAEVTSVERPLDLSFLKQPTSAEEAKELFHRLQVSVGPWLVERIPAADAKNVLCELLAAGVADAAAKAAEETVEAVAKAATTAAATNGCFSWILSFLKNKNEIVSK